MARVVLENVNKVYSDGYKAVKGFNLDIADQEFVVFVGPSGCGKSTTLRMIAGLEDISSGTLSIDGRVANDVPPKDRDIAMVFQNYALYPHMSVFENMAFALTLRKTSKAIIKDRVERAAKMLGLEPHLERKPKALSGGQRQRVAVGRAIVRDPKCFLFDEPLSNLDARLRVEMRTELKRIHMDLKSTTIYVTHDQEEAMTLGDRVVVMKDGVIQQCAPPLIVYRHPANRFVAGFVGTPPMNFINGRVVSDGGRLFFDGGPGVRLRVPEWAKAGVGARVGSEVVFGVRPQAIAAADRGRAPEPDSTLDCKVQLVEPLGDRMNVRLAVGSHIVTAEMEARADLVPNVALTVAVDLARVHFFDAGAGGESLAKNSALSS